VGVAVQIQGAASRRDCGASVAGDRLTPEERRQSSADERGPVVLRPALSPVSFDMQALHVIRPETAGSVASSRISLLLALEVSQ
jgi:hypothetical protein